MGCMNCKGWRVVGQNPKNIHVKKLNEIYRTYQKNHTVEQIADPSTIYVGSNEQLSSQQCETIARYSNS